MESSKVVVSEMLEKMRVKPDDDEKTVLSKKLSYVLRHGAKQLALTVGDGGHVRVNDLLAIEDLFGDMTEEALLQFVSESNAEKQRYELLEDDDSWLIRATGKHTIQGIEKPKERKPDNEKGGRRAGAREPIDEEEFCARWRLDRFARNRLSELPASSRQLAMTQFSPGPQVDASDFPKLFVAFCKRYRTKQKANGADDGEARPRAGLGKGRKLPIPVNLMKCDSDEALRSPRLGEGVAEAPYDCGAGYASPGSSPRCLANDRVVSPSMGAGSPAGRWYPPPEPPKIPVRVTQTAGAAPPPPPAHAPQVGDFDRASYPGSYTLGGGCCSGCTGPPSPYGSQQGGCSQQQLQQQQQLQHQQQMHQNQQYQQGQMQHQQHQPHGSHNQQQQQQMMQQRQPHPFQPQSPLSTSPCNAQHGIYTEAALHQGNQHQQYRQQQQQHHNQQLQQHQQHQQMHMQRQQQQQQQHQHHHPQDRSHHQPMQMGQHYSQMQRPQEDQYSPMAGHHQSHGGYHNSNEQFYGNYGGAYYGEGMDQYGCGGYYHHGGSSPMNNRMGEEFADARYHSGSCY
eukprot:TRINITY_DN1103_c1_g1_i1.p1 TRINITY_DN1103_c1_g1~~TRINITY_DN1103_c1_g1_i1.p1  ORF type:complete len:566 (+),score=122.93 TRINITY_DN1103_c1_g1_i1:132-1829(+)